MLKSTSLLVFLVQLFFCYFRHVWRHTRIRLFCLHRYALLRLDNKLFILLLCFKNIDILLVATVVYVV